MSYTSVTNMANSNSLKQRVIACAAQEGHTNPTDFANRKMLNLCADTGWVAAWDYAVAEATVNVNPDTGVRTDVISDAMILTLVQPIVQDEMNTEP